MKYAILIAVTLTATSASAERRFEPSLYDNCSGSVWSSKTWKCLNLTKAIREQLKRAEKFDALARRTTDELERKSYEAEATAARAAAAYLIDQWNKAQQ